MGSNTIIAIVVGAIFVIVGFALWPVLNGASNSLYSYFQDSCDDGNGNRFGKVYVGIDNATRRLARSGFLRTYNTDDRIHGGSGTNIVENSGAVLRHRYPRAVPPALASPCHQAPQPPELARLTMSKAM